MSILNASRVNNILASRHLYNMKTLFVYNRDDRNNNN